MTDDIALVEAVIARDGGITANHRWLLKAIADLGPMRACDDNHWQCEFLRIDGFTAGVLASRGLVTVSIPTGLGRPQLALTETGAAVARTYRR